MYKLKHVPTGLYYQPHKHRGSNLSKRGKVYQTATHGLSSAFRSAERHSTVAQRQLFPVYVERDSQIFKELENMFEWEECSWSHGQMKANTNVTDWVKEEIVELIPPVKRKTIAVISKDIEDFGYYLETYFKSCRIKYERLSYRKFEENFTTYYCITKYIDLCGMSPNRIVETPRAYQNKEYYDIIDIAKVYLPKGQKIEHEL